MPPDDRGPCRRCRRRPPIAPSPSSSDCCVIRRSRGAGPSAATCTACRRLRRMGEMHIRPDGYIGRRTAAGGGVNACVVSANVQRSLRQSRGLSDALRCTRDPLLARSVCAARGWPVRSRCSGHWPSSRRASALDGLLAAGDAAGFIDPMTGDGLRFAIEGAELAAAAALRALDQRLGRCARGGCGPSASARSPRSGGSTGCCGRSSSSPRALRGAAFGSRLAPGIVRALIAHAGESD